MWRGEGTATVGPGDATRPVQPDDLVVADPDVTVGHVADASRARIRAQAAALGGGSTLLHFTDTPDRGIDITSAHPSSLPQFLTGRPTLLSGLYRDEVARRTARLAAERIAAKNVELRMVRGR